MAWSDITKEKTFQNLPPSAKAQLKAEYFENHIAPGINDGPVKLDKQRMFQEWMSRPDDSGQSYGTSALSSVGRGVASIVPNVVGGVGYLTGSDDLVAAGDSIEQGINSALPINPIYEQTWGMKAFNAGGQAVGMLLTGGGTGLTTKAIAGLRSAQKVSQGVMLGQGFLAGARGGGQSADAMGLEGGDRWARAAIGGSIEFATERYLFGLGSETAAINRALGAPITETAGRTFIKAVGTEGVEEGVARLGNNLTDIAMAPPGVQASGPFTGVFEDTTLGAVGGGVFGGANVLTRGPQQKPPGAPAPVAGNPATTPEGTLAVQPVQAIRLRASDGKIYHRDENGAWSETGVPPVALGMPPMRLLNPGDVMDSAIITELDNKAANIARQTAPKPTSQEAAPAVPPPQTAVSTPPPPVEGPPVANPAESAPAPVVVDTTVPPPETPPVLPTTPEGDNNAQQDETPVAGDEVSFISEDGGIVTGTLQRTNETGQATVVVPGQNKPAEMPASKLMKGTSLERWADRVIKESRGKMMAGAGGIGIIDPVLATAYAVKATAAIIRTGMDFARWSTEMVKEHGENVRQYLQTAWATAQQKLAQEDEQYLAAVESNPKAAAKMVKARAKAAGYSDKPVHHGTTHSFEVFDMDRANIENDFGRGAYFSNAASDVNANYAGEGPDLTNRIERLAEQLEANEDLEPEEAKVRAREQLVGEGKRSIKAFLRFENPAILGGKGETMLTGELDDDTGMESGPLFDFLNELRNAANYYDDGEVDNAIQSVLDESGYSDISLARAIEIIRADEQFNYYQDPQTGDLAGSEIIRDALERSGFDGIIDRTVNKKFGSERRTGKQMQGMDEKTVHYIAFQPEQVKSADTVTRDAEGKPIPLSKRFNKNNRSILYADPLGIVLMANVLTTMARQAVDLAAFTSKAVARFGEWIRPHLQAIFDKARESAKAVEDYLKTVWTQEAANAAQAEAQANPPAQPEVRNETQQPNQAAQNRSTISSRYVRFMPVFEALKATMQLAKSSRDERTVDGQKVPVLAYDVRTDNAMRAATGNMMDALAFQQVGPEEIKTLLSTGRAAGVDLSLELDERAILGRHMLQSGRFSEFGLLRSELLPIMQEIAGKAGMIGREWNQVLDPIDRVKDEAATQTEKEMAKVGASWETMESALAEAADRHIDKETKAAIDRVKRKNLSLSPGELADTIRNIFFPQEKTLAQKLMEDGARAIANAFFRDGKGPQPGPLQEGADFVKGELTSLLNEALDALGIERADEAKDPNLEYRRLVTELGLMDMRSGKMEVVDQLVRERIDQYAEEGATEFADDLIDQWELVSAHMMGRAASDATLRRVVNAQLQEGKTTVAQLAKETPDKIAATIAEQARVMKERVNQAGTPEAGGLAPDAIARLEGEFMATAHQMVRDAQDKAARRQAERNTLRNSPAEVTRRAAAILDGLATQLSDTPPAEGVEQQRDAVRALISDALRADEDMTMLREMLMDLGVSEDVAASLELVVLEARRRKEGVAAARQYQQRQEARAKAITDLVDKLAGRKENKEHGERLGKFLGNLKRADEYGILDKDFFAEAFAHAFDLNGLTPAIAQQLRETWQALQAVDANGRRKLFGMARETAERQFMEAVNAVAPGTRWDNLIFNQYQAGVLSSISSIFNQFSGIFRVIMGVDSIARTTARGDVQNVAHEWWTNVANLVYNLPLVLTGVKGESLGHLPPQLRASFAPTEQRVQLTREGQRLRVRTPRGSTITVSERTRKVLRLKELWTWRTIRGAEALSGITDAQARFRDVLTEYYKKQGLTPADANARARQDINSSPTERAAAEAQALREQEAGEIGTGQAVINRRVQEIIARYIEERLNEDLVARVEQMTAAAQFKSVPVGMVGHPIYTLFNNLAASDNPGSRVARFFFLFGRFLGHTVDSMLAYAPGLHMFTLGRESDSKRNKIIKEIYGDVATYNRLQHGKAAAGTAFLIANGLLMALAEALADDDDEPFFQVFGNAPLASRDQKEALMATGKWQESVVRIFGQNLNYSQIPELAALFTALGNASDYAKFSQQLYTKDNKVLPVQDAAIGGIGDTLSAPIKRSTYRQYFDFVSSMMAGRKSDAFANIATGPVGGMLRVPLVVDADKIYRQLEGGKDAKGLGQNFLRRIPFVHVGDTMLNAYGEKLPALSTIMMFPADAKAEDPNIVKAATINVETGTVRGMPRLPEMINGVQTTSEQKEAYAVKAGGYFVESLLRNEQAIRRAFEKGGPEAAKKVVSNISSKANERARKELGLVEQK
jgi:hypothetical protein